MSSHSTAQLRGQGVGVLVTLGPTPVLVVLRPPVLRRLLPWIRLLLGLVGWSGLRLGRQWSG